MLQALKMGANELLQVQQKSGGIEIAGDIRCNPDAWKHGGRKWEVFLEICEDPTAKKNMSHPSCGGKRKCGKRRTHTETWVDVGEFHTHPAANHPRVCKPPSHLDVYQLVVAAHLQHHNYVATVCAEGIYIISSTRRATEAMMKNVVSYYHLKIHEEQHTRQDIERNINQCRMPLVELIPRSLKQLYAIMVGLSKTYYDLLENTTEVPDQNTFIRLYLNAVENVGVEASFYGTH